MGRSRIASVEMVEAVGQDYWPAYLQTIARVLKPGGRAALQARLTTLKQIVKDL